MYATHANDFSFAHDTDLSKDSLTTDAKRFKLVLHSGNAAMLIAVLGMLLSIFVGYVLAEQFSLWAQVASHITLILCATAIKIGYVMRCIGLHGLGATQL
ncbi:hypothetical protein FM037_05150 [Shewanella psychropiezotolerans]|uniref:Uncharacterized protein n=1 Tax=Shewanella psychropiezotolerans TaxID=2593655 RepID=A0ABX5WUF1_9GAMM|nr:MULTISPECIES: hypothetical protein [Shewanella]MPY23075.1 hypothetical protein [Shewanella sp. YLB-07]QDO82730.1 hypothetical protein FM037_05150 [Shewanella psychropiezotolerans]